MNFKQYPFVSVRETYGHKSITRNVTDEEERFKSSLIVRPLSNILLCCVNESYMHTYKKCVKTFFVQL